MMSLRTNMAVFIKETMTNSSAYNFFIPLDSLINAANFLTDIICVFTFIRYLVIVSKIVSEYD